MLSLALIQKISQEVYRRFPEVSGAKPELRTRDAAGTKAAAKSPTYLLIYRGKVKTADQKSMPRWIRVVVDEGGKILKLTTSR